MNDKSENILNWVECYLFEVNVSMIYVYLNGGERYEIKDIIY